MRIKKILSILVLLGIISVPIVLYYFGGSVPAPKSIYETNWDIVIPSDYQSIYQSKDKHDSQGKGNRYTIFSTEEIASTNLIPLQKSTKNIHVFNGTSNDSNSNRSGNNEIETFVQTVTSGLNIPKNCEPEFSKYYLWQKFIRYGKTLVVLYFPDSNKVYFIEQLI